MDALFAQEAIVVALKTQGWVTNPKDVGYEFMQPVSVHALAKRIVERLDEFGLLTDNDVEICPVCGGPTIPAMTDEASYYFRCANECEAEGRQAIQVPVRGHPFVPVVPGPPKTSR